LDNPIVPAVIYPWDFRPRSFDSNKVTESEE
jgi:hypothetical protein